VFVYCALCVYYWRRANAASISACTTMDVPGGIWGGDSGCALFLQLGQISIRYNDIAHTTADIPRI